MTTDTRLSRFTLRLSVVFLILTSLTACSRDESPVTPTDPTRIEANTPQELRKGLDNFLSVLSQNPSILSKIAQSHQKYGNRLAQNLSVGLPLDSILTGLANTQVTINGVPHFFEVHAWNPEAAANALRKLTNQNHTTTLQSGGYEHPSIAFMIDPDGESYPDEDDSGNRMTTPSQHLVHLINGTTRVLTLFPNNWEASQNSYNTLYQELSEHAQEEVAILILEPTPVDRQWVGCPTDENGVYLRGSGTCSGPPNPNGGGGSGIGGSSGSGTPDKLHLVSFNLKRKYDGRSRDEIEFFTAYNNGPINRYAETRVYCRHKGWYNVNRNLMTLENARPARFIAIEDDNAQFIHRSKTFLGALFGNLTAALAAVYLVTTLDPVGTLYLLSKGFSKEVVKNTAGTDNSKWVKGFDVQTQTVRDVFEMFHIGGLTWNADDILPESEVLGMTQSNMMIRTNGAAIPYEIRDRLADMDYNLALRP